MFLVSQLWCKLEFIHVRNFDTFWFSNFKNKWI